MIYIVFTGYFKYRDRYTLYLTMLGYLNGIVKVRFVMNTVQYHEATCTCISFCTR